MTAWGVIFSLIITGILLVDCNGTFKRKGWRIYFAPLSCPHCKTRPPLVRVPSYFGKFVWRGNGWTCQACGAEVDNWGHLLSPPASDEIEGSDRR
jgi:hypothetical protein